ncbi:MAG: histidinol-phosphatase HisJ [Epsilonproteobacteria bacterium]|nr:histidinol-phosphatase HisJ [Campylobacterota bacterium]
MKVDLHNHTPLCKHATGEIRDYVKRAIEEGIELFGFSDHAPMGFDKRYRMELSQTKEYEEKVKKVALEFKDKIEVRVGYEVDFLPNFLEKSILRANVDYLIGSIHFIPQPIGLWGFDNPEFLTHWKEVDVDEVYKIYFSLVEEMAKSKLFQIVGHLDLIKIFGFRPKTPVKDLALKALKEIKKADMAIEINSSGLRKKVKEQYPSKELLELIYEMQIPITFGSDAHKVEDVGKGLEGVKKLAKEIGFSEVAVFENKKMELVKF